MTSGRLDATPESRFNRSMGGVDALAGIDPEQLLLDPAPVREQQDGSSARALTYSRADGARTYDEIGFRLRAATPRSGPAPLQTVLGMRLQRKWAQNSELDERVEELMSQQVLLRHRPLEIFDGTDYDLQHDRTLVHFKRRVGADDGGRGHEEVWTFPLSAPPAMLLRDAVDFDAPQLSTQAYRLDLPGQFWLPLTRVIETGRFERMQECRDHLVTQAEPGRFYAFLSHRWLSTDEPDPDGAQARLVAWQLLGRLCDAIRVASLRGLGGPRRFNPLLGVNVGPHGSDLAESLLVNVLRPALDDELLEQARKEAASLGDVLGGDSGVRTAHADAGLTRLAEVVGERPLLAALLDRIHVWYDYSCLPQPPRTDEEETLFRDGLEHLVAFQIVGRTAVVLEEAEDYLSRAWCTLEALVADSTGGYDLLVGSARRSAREGTTEHYFETLLLDRPHIVWRALLDTEVFRVQTPAECLARLNLEATDPDDLPYIYDRLRHLRAPANTHLDGSEVVTGAFPLPVVEGGRFVVPRTSDRRIGRDDERSDPGTIDWTDALAVAPGPFEVPPFVEFPGEHPSCHVAVVASCEGEAILFGHHVLDRRPELEEAVGARVGSFSWVATAIAPVGHIAFGNLKAVAVAGPVWVIVATSGRFLNCGVTGAITGALAAAGVARVELRLDVAEQNLVLVRPPAESVADDAFEA